METTPILLPSPSPSPSPSPNFLRHTFSLPLQRLAYSFDSRFSRFQFCNLKSRIRLRNCHRLTNVSFANVRKSLCTTCSVTEETSSILLKKKAVDISSALKGTSIFLVGMNCSIKTKVGKLLADTLRYYYFDSDSLVEEAAGGASAAKRYKESDERGFRESETEVLKQLSSMGRLVVCAGDGVVQSSTNLALVRHGISLWIDVPLEMGAGALIEDHDSLPEALTQLSSLYAENKGGYATADATVSLQKVASKLGYDELDAVTAEDMALEVLKEIGKLTRVKKMMEEAARPF